MEITMIGAYVGMILVLAAFVFETRGLLSSRSLLYLYSMGIGETMLTIRAGVTGEWPLQYWVPYGQYLPYTRFSDPSRSQTRVRWVEA